MKSIKKLTALVLCVSIIVFSAISAGAAGSYFLSEDFYYGVADNKAYVHGYQGTESDVVIREKFLSYYVTAVDSFAFFRNETIETLSLYDATMLTELGQCAFAECVNLKYVEIPSSVQTMGDSVFDSCASLDYVVVLRWIMCVFAAVPSHRYPHRHFTHVPRWKRFCLKTA